jgi:hypothetical protein
MVIIIRNAPKVDLIIDGKTKTVYAFLETSLKDLRTIANLSDDFKFIFESLEVSKFEEAYIFVGEIDYENRIIVKSSYPIGNPLLIVPIQKPTIV